MGWLRFVIRVGVVWLMSLVVAAIGLELAHRVVLATERNTTPSLLDGPREARGLRLAGGVTGP